MKQCLITGGGSKFGANLTEQFLAQGYHVHLITSNTESWENRNNVSVIAVDWKKLQLSDIKKYIPATDKLDLIFFNHNASSLNQNKFKKFTLQNCQDWQQSYFVACQFPFYLTHALQKQIAQTTKVGWMLSELIVCPMDSQVGFADYIGNKFTNACIMKSFSLNFPACFFGIHPDGGLADQTLVDTKARGIVQLIHQKLPEELNGNIFSTQGEKLELYEKNQC